MFINQFVKNVKLNNDFNTNALIISTTRGTAPNFPFVVEITPKLDNIIKIKGLMKVISSNSYKMIPIINL